MDMDTLLEPNKRKSTKHYGKLEAEPMRHFDKDKYRMFELENGKPTHQPGARFEANAVLTSQYKWWNFVPLNLWEQFHAVSNCYFFLIGVLQTIPSISATQGVPDMWMTLFVIMGISAARAAIEDYARHQADRRRNSALYEVLKGRNFEPTESGDIVVGDVVKVKQNQMIPADMLFLGSSLVQGHCFLDRANLNGETKLEVMNSLLCTRPFCTPSDGLFELVACLDYEPPNKRFDEFKGYLYIANDQNIKETVDGKVLLMRETNLRNCDYIFGLVVYTGEDTKIQRSSKDGDKVPMKKSAIFSQVDWLLAGMFGLQLCMCLVGGFVSAFLSVEDAPGSKWYLVTVNHPILEGVERVFTWIILLSQMVPISLLMTAELVKFMQARFIQWDLDLYYPAVDKAAKVNRSTLHEDLGLVDFIFSDKTGTLTQNKMEFRFMSLPAGQYGSKETEIAKSVARREQELQGEVRAAAWTDLERPFLCKSSGEPDCCQSGCPCFVPCWNGEPAEHREDSAPQSSTSTNEFSKIERDALLQGLWGAKGPDETEEECAERKHSLRRYLTHMALSNTIKPFVTEEVLQFQAESAEELAMVQFAQSCGFTKLAQNPTVLRIVEYDENLDKVGEVDETYNHLATFGFTSKRARVTVIYQRVDDDQHSIFVMTKGQDTVVLPMLSEIQGDMGLEEELNRLCANGLRTLVCAYASLPASWWDQVGPQYRSLVNRPMSATSEKHADGECDPEECNKCIQHKCFGEWEQQAGLHYLGLMGLEDQLQLLVPETIKDCIRAGIKVWMITGDKLETAKNIGLACNLIDPDMQVRFQKGYNMEQCMQAFKRTRLIEITGQWADLAQNDAELRQLFALFDYNKDGTISLKELQFLLKALRCSVAEDKDKLAHLFDGLTEHGRMTETGFVDLMKSTQLSEFDAVRFDVNQGRAMFQDIEDHEHFPVSMLVTRGAFLTLFPELTEGYVTDPLMEGKLEELRHDFFELARVSKSLVFARAEPCMKKKMVTEMKKRFPKLVTLAIGDGANDVDMIRAAHIGVGIAGVEGTGAVNSADYAIGTFRMLHTLLFVHGYWSYRRNAFMVNFICYKALMFALPCYIFGFYSRFAAQRLWESVSAFSYNLFYTSMPVMAVAVFDKMLPRSILQNNVAAYREQKGKLFTPGKFLKWMLRAILHAFFLFFVPYFSLVSNSIGPSGKSMDLWYFSMTVFMSLVILATAMSFFDMHNVTVVHWFCLIFCSMGSLFTINTLAGFVPIVTLFGVNQYLLFNFQFWFVSLATVMPPLVIELFLRAVKVRFSPSLSMWLQEMLRKKGPDYMMKPEDEDQWLNRKPRHKRKEQLEQTTVLSTGKQMDPVAVITGAMLRFRNLTGGQFESAGCHLYQRHDASVVSSSRINAGAGYKMKALSGDAIRDFSRPSLPSLPSMLSISPDGLQTGSMASMDGSHRRVSLPSNSLSQQSNLRDATLPDHVSSSPPVAINVPLFPTSDDEEVAYS